MAMAWGAIYRIKAWSRSSGSGWQRGSMVNQQETGSSVIGQGGTEDQCDGGTLD